MKRTRVNFIINGLIAIGMLVLMATGMIQTWILPPGTNHTLALWNLSRHEWGDVHLWFAVGTVALVFVHIILHWRWIIATSCRLIPGKRFAHPSRHAMVMIGVVSAFLIVGSFFGFWRLATTKTRQIVPGKLHEQEKFPIHDLMKETEDPELDRLRGHMHLHDVAMLTGLSDQMIRERLGIPASTASDKRLGDLGRKHGFSMHDARQRLAANGQSLKENGAWKNHTYDE